MEEATKEELACMACMVNLEVHVVVKMVAAYAVATGQVILAQELLHVLGRHVEVE